MNRNRIAARLQTSRMPKLTRDSAPRVSTPGQSKFPMKDQDPLGVRDLIEQARAARALCAQGQAFVDEQHARKR